MPTVVVGRPDPFTVVVIEGVRLGAYAAGGLNISFGELGTVDHATVYPHKASGASFLSGFRVDFVVTSGSGNIATVTAGLVGSGEAPASMGLSSYPLAAIGYGH